MIGFLTPVNLPQSLSRLARTYQCGLCRTVKETYGMRYSLFAGSDMVFFNIFLDAAAAQDPPVVQGSCIVVPQRLFPIAVRSRTEHARFTAAFGIAMAVAKLEDDYKDEGGFFRWLAWRFFRPGGERARADLAAMGFDVGELDAWMARQAEIEGGETRGLEEAAVPTARIAQLLCARAHLSAGAAIGECVGRFLFYVDNLLDFFDDVRRHHYNALARAFDVESVPQRLPPAVASAGLAGARAQVEALAPLVAQLPATPQRDYVQRVLQQGFRYKLERFEALAVAEGKRPGLSAISRPALPWYRRFAITWQLAIPRMRVALSLAVFVLAPRSAWAAQWMASSLAGAAGHAHACGSAPDADCGGTAVQSPMCDSFFSNASCCGLDWGPTCGPYCSAPCGWFVDNICCCGCPTVCHQIPG